MGDPDIFISKVRLNINEPYRPILDPTVHKRVITFVQPMAKILAQSIVKILRGVTCSTSVLSALEADVLFQLNPHL